MSNRPCTIALVCVFLRHFRQLETPAPRAPCAGLRRNWQHFAPSCFHNASAWALDDGRGSATSAIRANNLAVSSPRIIATSFRLTPRQKRRPATGLSAEVPAEVPRDRRQSRRGLGKVVRLHQPPAQATRLRPGDEPHLALKRGVPPTHQEPGCPVQLRERADTTLGAPPPGQIQLLKDDDWKSLDHSVKHMPLDQAARPKPSHQARAT